MIITVGKLCVVRQRLYVRIDAFIRSLDYSTLDSDMNGTCIFGVYIFRSLLMGLFLSISNTIVTAATKQIASIPKVVKLVLDKSEISPMAMDLYVSSSVYVCMCVCVCACVCVCVCVYVHLLSSPAQVVKNVKNTFIDSDIRHRMVP